MINTLDALRESLVLVDTYDLPDIIKIAYRAQVNELLENIELEKTEASADE